MYFVYISLENLINFLDKKMARITNKNTLDDG
jgi:hypothetical protein